MQLHNSRPQRSGGLGAHHSVPRHAAPRNCAAAGVLLQQRRAWVAQASRQLLESPEAAAADILNLWARRDLDGLLPYMSELAVVKAVVRQHHAKVVEQKQQEKRLARLAQQQHSSQQQQQQQQQAAASQPPRALSSGSASPATYHGTPPAGMTYDSFDSYDELMAQHDASRSAQRWQAPLAYPTAPPQPARPPCPVPGANASSSSNSSSSLDYVGDYESFNYARRFAANGARGSAAAAGAAASANAAARAPMEPQQAPPTPPPQAAAAAAAAAAAPAQPAAAPEAPDFLAVLDAAQASDAGHQLLDSFAMRHLVLSRPAQLEPLSSMQLSRDAFVLRCRSTSLWGEKCVLTLTLRRRSLAEQRSMYSKQPVKQPWVVSKVAGEPCSDDPLQAISPEHPPEAVVAAQVAALRECDFDVAYALTSPVGRAVAGTRDRFRAALQGDFRYQPLLMHERAASIHRTHSNANTYLEVFDVQGQPGYGKCLYIWVATRQLEGLYRDCWMIEYVTPVRDPAVIKALQIGL